MPSKCGSDSNDFLLEIGTEELPSGFIEPALGQLRQNTVEKLTEYRLKFKKIDVMATPRRLVLFIEDLSTRQEQAYELKWGPPKSVAFDSQGRPTQTFEGFRKSQGVRPEEIQIKIREGKGEYLCLLKEKPVRPTRQLLPEILPALITSIQFPKNMRWNGALSFARPIRWLLAIYGSSRIKFCLGNLTSGSVTYGHRIFSPGPYRIREVEDYFEVIKKAGIILDPRKRKDNIRRKLCRQADRLMAGYEFNEELLDEVNYLVETPVVICGRFKEEYLKLPPEVLSTSMAKNQKLFCFSTKKGLLPRFAAVLNGRVKNINLVRRNYESILEAKLKDSQFFYQEDTRSPLEEKVEQLKKVVFHEQLGSLFDKTQRMVNLAGVFAQRVGLSPRETQNLQRAVYLAKADLVTQMVVEFPGLQGIMGREYARASGESEEVAQAIGEHYLPRSASDCLPASRVGALTSIVDKIDNITGCFFLGQEPSGSYDPFALKRQASGIIRIILDQKWALSLTELIGTSLGFYFSTEDTTDKIEEIKRKILLFFRERIYNLFIESKFSYDLIEAVMASGYDDVTDTWNRIEQLNSIFTDDRFEQARNVVERTNNIIKGVKIDLDKEVEEDLFVDNLETQLWQVYKAKRDQIEQLIDEAKYKEATFVYGRQFFEIIHRFFDQVLVNVEDEKLRANRLRMMRYINRLYTHKVADLAKIVVVKNPVKK